MKILYIVFSIVLLASCASAEIVIKKKAAGGGTTFSDDFGGTLSNWTPSSPSHVSISGGILAFSGEGFLRHNTDLGSGNIYAKFQIKYTNVNNLVGLCSSSGSCRGLQIATESAASYTDGYTDYTTYTTYDTSGGLSHSGYAYTFSATQYYGITFNRSTNVVKVWTNVTASAPTDVDTWDGVGAHVTASIGSAFPGNYFAFGSWTGSPGSLGFDNVSGGAL